MTYLVIYLFLNAFLVTYALCDWGDRPILDRVMTSLFIVTTAPLLFLIAGLEVAWKRLMGKGHIKQPTDN